MRGSFRLGVGSFRRFHDSQAWVRGAHGAACSKQIFTSMDNRTCMCSPISFPCKEMVPRTCFVNHLPELSPPGTLHLSDLDNKGKASWKSINIAIRKGNSGKGPTASFRHMT